MSKNEIYFSRGLFLAPQYKKLVPVLLFVGFALRLILVFSPTNFDFDSYKITANLIVGGIPPWQSQRYNYGISWSLVLGCFYLVSSGNDFIFRFAIIAFLSFADFAIYLILRRWFGYKPALIFFLNPISIIITGHYNQFDNLAIAVALIAIDFLVKFKELTRIKYLILCICFLTLSLTVKHTLVLFLLWFMFSNFSFRIKSALILVPYALFLLHFVPFMIRSQFDRDSILSAVFKYWSANNAPFWKFWFWDKEYAESLGDHTAWHHGRIWMILMFISVFTIGYILSYKPLQYQIPAFSIAILIFSSAITSQFLAIATLGAAVYFNTGFLLFFILGALYLCLDPAGLSISWLQPLLEHRGWNAWNISPSILLFAVCVQIFKSRNSHIS